MKFGLFMGVWENPTVQGDQHKLLHDVCDYISVAEECGFVSAMFTEHHFTGLPQIPCSLTVIPYLAARTTTIRLGTAVIVVPWHNPLMLAEQIATIDLLSSGRFDCGVGPGFRYSETQGFGIPPEELRDRLDEALEVLRLSWTAEGRFSFHGKFWSFTDAIIDPKPYQKPHPPIWAGGGRPESIQKTAQAGNNVLLAQFNNTDYIGERVTMFREAVEANGDVWDPMRLGVTRPFHLADNAGEKAYAVDLHTKVLANNRKLSAPPTPNPVTTLPPHMLPERGLLIGTPHEIIAELKGLQDVGVEYVLLLDVGGDPNSLRRFARDVMPAFA